MKFSKLAATALTASTLALSSLASASVVTVDGVSWNTSSIFDFSSQNSIFEKPVFLIGDTLSGIGKVNQVNSSSSFCVGCELTFEFGGYTLLDNNFGVYDPDGPGGISAASYGISGPSMANFGEFKFTGGWLNIYVDYTPNFSAEDKTTAVDGNLWLSLQAVDAAQLNTGVTLQGNLTQLFANGLAGQGTGLFNVVGGSAAPHLNTNGQIGGADLSYTSSFQPLGYDEFGNPLATGDGYTHFGTSEVKGNSITVPEPSAVALMGLGLLGFSFARSRKKTS